MIALVLIALLSMSRICAVGPRLTDFTTKQSGGVELMR